MYIAIISSALLVIIYFFALYFIKSQKLIKSNLLSVFAILSNAGIFLGIFSFLFEIVKQKELEAKKTAMSFTLLTQKGVLDLEKFFMTHNNSLKYLYYEIYGTLGFPIPEGKPSIKDKQMEFHAIAYMIQIIEDVYTVMELNKNYDDKDLAGWLNTFRMWGSSKTFKKIWSSLKTNYGTNFIKFVESIILNKVYTMKNIHIIKAI